MYKDYNVSFNDNTYEYPFGYKYDGQNNLRSNKVMLGKPRGIEIIYIVYIHLFNRTSSEQLTCKVYGSIADF